MQDVHHEILEEAVFVFVSVDMKNDLSPSLILLSKKVTQ